MVETIGDIVAPVELIIPEATGTTKTLDKQSGAMLFISGSALHFIEGAVVTKV